MAAGGADVREIQVGQLVAHRRMDSGGVRGRLVPDLTPDPDRIRAGETMTSWTDQQLRTFGDAGEIRLATERPDGTERRAVPIWVVRAGEGVFVRSYNGSDGSWYRQVVRHPRARITAAGMSARVELEAVSGPTPEVDAAYAAKYGHSGYGAAMIRPAAAATTLRLRPADA